MGACRTAHSSGVAWNSVGITRFQLPTKSAEAAQRNLLRRLPSTEPGTPTPEVGEAIAAAQRYFEGKETDFSGFKLDLRPPRTITESRYEGVRRRDSGRQDSGSRRTLVSRMG